MAILAQHVEVFEQMLSVCDITSGPAIIFGHQELRATPGLHAALAVAEASSLEHVFSIPEDYAEGDLASLLRRRGVPRVLNLDYFDARAELRLDMNQPLPRELRGSSQTFIDIGSLEHVFDTRQCLENSLRTLQLGGHYCLATCISGFFAHGLHVFNPLALSDALLLNGFSVVFRQVTYLNGKRLSSGDEFDSREHAVVWLVGQKQAEMPEAFVCPQQRYWQSYYASDGDRTLQREIQQRYWDSVATILPISAA